MEDGHAREGVLSRCNRDREATLADVECANARRAATAAAVEVERGRADEFERQSEEKLLALRAEEAVRSAAVVDAESAARAAAAAAYEARWPNPNEPQPSAEAVDMPAPVFGAPLGVVLPSISDSTVFVYPEGVEALSHPVLEASAVEPPENELVIPDAGVEVLDLAAVPRPFRDAAAE